MKIAKAVRQPINYVILSSLCALALGVRIVFYNLDKGLDLTDESWIYMLLQGNQVTPGEPWGFQHLLQPLWSAFGSTAVGARIARFVLYQIGVIAAALALIRWSVALALPFRARTGIIIALGAEAAMLLAWVSWPRSFGYNELSSFLVTVGVSIAVILVANSRINKAQSRFHLWIAPSLLGVISSVLLLTKATSGLIFTAGACATVLLTSPLTRQMFLRGAAYVTSFFVAVFAVWSVGFPLRNYINSVWRMAVDADYSASFAHSRELIPANFEDLISTGMNILPELILIMAATTLLVVAKASSRERLFANLGVFGIIIALLLFVGRLRSETETISKSAVLGLAMGITALGILLINEWSVSSNDRYRLRVQIASFVAGIGISVAPFVSSIGTNGQLSAHITFDLTLWGAAFGLAVVLILHQLDGHRIKQLIASLVLPVVAFSVWGLLRVDAAAPYRTDPYAIQDEPIDDSSRVFAGLLVSPELASTLNWLGNLGDGYQDVPVIAPGAPGAILAFNANSFASPWTESFWPGSYDTVIRRCESRGAPSQLIVILSSLVLPGTADYQMTSEVLEQCGIRFPDDFQLLGVSPSSRTGVSYSVYIYDVD